VGAPFSTNVSVTPAQVYVPSPSGTPSVFIANGGRYPVWVGGSAVTSVAGLELSPGASMTLPNAAQGIFAVSGFTPGTAGPGTVLSNIAQGGSVISVASGGTAFTTGSDIVIESGSVRQEVQAVAAQNGTTVTISGTFAYAHGSTVTFSQVVPAQASVTVSAGAV
jgi:hypothetical protein